MYPEGTPASMADRKQIRRRVAAMLRAARKSKQLTQEELVARAGCSVETLSNAERGASLPGLELFLDLATLLDLDLVSLVDSSRRPASRTRLALEAEAIFLARSLSDDRLRLWLETGQVFKRG